MNAYIPIASTTDENEAELALTLLRGSGLPAKREKLGGKYYVLSSKPVTAQKVLVEHGIVKLTNPIVYPDGTVHVNQDGPPIKTEGRRIRKLTDEMWEILLAKKLPGIDTMSYEEKAELAKIGIYV